MSSVRKESRFHPDTPVQYLKGVGEGRAELFAAAGIRTVRDLLFFFPFRYEDRRHPVTIADLAGVRSPVVLRGRIVSAGLKTSPVRQMKVLEAILDDGTGTVMLVWFNQQWLAERVRKDAWVSIYGQPKISARGRMQIEGADVEVLQPDEESADEGCIVPVYSTVSGIAGKRLRAFVAQALEAAMPLDDPLPEEIRHHLRLIELSRAVVQLHRPEQLDEAFLSGRSPAHRRLIVEEFFAFQLALRLRRASEERRGKPRTLVIDDAIREKVRKMLPFRLTAAQKRVLKEIAGDLQGSAPMYRLLQGDVGSGKTIVALIAALIAVANRHQAALLAPTEILVEQHYRRISQLVDDSVALRKLTASTPASDRREILAGLRDGSIDLVVGTHALLEDPVAFRSFGLAIVDEQHRFGVVQRQKLFEKGELPDVLVMTATPIPRSLAIAIYGDLELSVIDELPPGRQPVKTVVRGSGRLPRVWQFVEGEIAEGAQAFVVFPLIDESEKVELKALVTGVERIREAFPGRRIEMLHGRMSGDEKEAVMRRFERGEVDILVSTTVIEVGIDVPNASTMIIIDADRFGLAQLHQLRGRIGRGSRKSYCILVREERASEEAKKRLRMFEATTDGFEVAERDLELRGAGEFFGTRQSGLPPFRFGDILRDHRLMELARREAIECIARDGVEKCRQLLERLAPERSGLARQRD